MTAVLLGISPAGRAASYGDPDLRLDFTLLDVPFNTNHHYAFPSMEQSLDLTKAINVARVILNWALKWVSGQELAEMGSRRCFAALNHETPTILLG